MLNYSLPPKNQPGYTVAHLQQFGDLISRHKYSAIAAVCLILIATTIVVIFTQRSTARSEKNSQAVTVEQKTLPADSPANTPASAEPTTASSEGSSTSTEFNSDNGQASLRVNNQQIPVPENGSVHRTVSSDDGNSNVNVSVNSSSSSTGTSNSSSSTSIQLNTSSDVNVDNSD